MNKVAWRWFANGGLLFILVSVAGLSVYGYFMNLHKLWILDNAVGQAFIRVLGVLFPPLGAVMGFV